MAGKAREPKAARQRQRWGSAGEKLSEPKQPTPKKGAPYKRQRGRCPAVFFLDFRPPGVEASALI